ncbi:unnamed protein product [Peniophora sp. CBMAI 1063]|nr:unnamed protein product [Peniophora sp. CBMAI 1063]
MGAVDPSYPLYPIASLVSAALLLLVLLTSFIRQSWNLGVAFLCFWLFLQNLTSGISAILWSNNADVKHYIYCDIVSHLDVICSIVKPMSTFIITRRLYLITDLRSVELPSPAARRWNMICEWTMGLIVPLVFAGPIYYIVQAARFGVYEGFKCSSALSDSVLTLLLFELWSIVLPLVSLVTYYPRVALVFYSQGKLANRFLRSNGSISRLNYFRILALASIDILVTLPLGITTLVLAVLVFREFDVPFYLGWDFVHSDFEPFSLTYARMKAAGAGSLAQRYCQVWTSPILAFVTFGLFGLTSEACAMYGQPFKALGARLGWGSPSRSDVSGTIGSMKFGTNPGESTEDSELQLSTPRLYVDLGAPTAGGTSENKSEHASEFPSAGCKDVDT